MGALMSAMHAKIRAHWKFTTFLFVVGIIEFGIVALYLSIDFMPPQPPRYSNVQVRSYVPFSIAPKAPAHKEAQQLRLNELFKDRKAIDKRLSKLLHDYFKETQSNSFTPSELVGLLNFDLDQVKRYALQEDDLVLSLNPRMLSTDEGIKAIA